MAKYTIGIDFGTLSGRALLVDVSDGGELAASEYAYPHGVMDKALPCGKPLGTDWALQHPQDYIDALKYIIPDAIKKSGVNPEDIIALSADFTTCTVLPVDSNAVPLCFKDEYKREPHAYAKLWKHHAAVEETERINRLAEERGEPWLKMFGGRISSEFMLPKIWQTLNECEKVYRDAYSFIEAGDWILWLLSGVNKRSREIAACRALWTPDAGYPSREFLGALDERLYGLVEEKLPGEIVPMFTPLGVIRKEMAESTGLPENALIVSGVGDGAAPPFALKAACPGKTCAIMGTSCVFYTISERMHIIPGVLGVFQDSVLPGYVAYETGQSCFGDLFSWFVKNCAPRDYYDAAEKEGKNIYELLNEKAASLRPGESGIIALDWWNGNRSTLSNTELTGLWLGQTLSSTPEELYRSLVESVCFGARKILTELAAGGAPTDEICATGGICDKSPFIMQRFADIVGVPVRISGASNGSALSMAIIAAVGAGEKLGGWDDYPSAIAAMGNLRDSYYAPNPDNKAIYDRLYEEYVRLYDYFGRGGNDAMQRLRRLRYDVKNS